MSSNAIEWAWDQDVGQNEKLLLLFVADNSDWLGWGTELKSLLSAAPRACGFDTQTLDKHLADLEERGLLIRTAGDCYRLQIDRKPRNAPFRLDVASGTQAKS